MQSPGIKLLFNFQNDIGNKVFLSLCYVCVLYIVCTEHFLSGPQSAMSLLALCTQRYTCSLLVPELWLEGDL